MLDISAGSDTHRHAQVPPASNDTHVTRGGPLRMLIADDHEMIRFAMRCALAGLAALIEWREASCAEGVATALESEPDLDLALLDFTMPGAGSVDWIASVRTRHPALPIVVLSAREEPALIRKLVALGVAGYIPKTDPPRVIRRAVELVLAGGSYVAPRLLADHARDHAPTAPAAPRPGSEAAALGALNALTPRQADVMRLLARGRPNKLIARQLGMSEATVKVHLLAIYRAFGVRNRTEAVIAAQCIDGPAS